MSGVLVLLFVNLSIIGVTRVTGSCSAWLRLWV
jgi:hypothetical protein